MLSRTIVISSTVKNDNHLGLGGVSMLNVSVHVLPEITECDSNQSLTCFEMLMFLIVAVLPHGLSL